MPSASTNSLKVSGPMTTYLPVRAIGGRWGIGEYGCPRWVPVTTIVAAQQFSPTATGAMRVRLKVKSGNEACSDATAPTIPALSRAIGGPCPVKASVASSAYIPKTLLCFAALIGVPSKKRRTTSGIGCDRFGAAAQRP